MKNKKMLKYKLFIYVTCYYLYQISKDNKYLETIVKIKKYKNLSEHTKEC